MRLVESRDWHAHVDKAGSDLLTKVGRAVLEDAKTLCPVSRDGSNGNAPGHLRRSLRMARSDSTVRVGSDVDYSVWVEEGHRVAYRQSASVTVGDTRYVTYGPIIYTGEVVPPEPFLRPSLLRERSL